MRALRALDIGSLPAPSLSDCALPPRRRPGFLTFLSWLKFLTQHASCIGYTWKTNLPICLGKGSLWEGRRH